MATSSTQVDSQTWRPDPLRPDSFPVLMRALRNEDRDEFLEGFGKHLHRFDVDGTPEAAEALLGYVRSWVISVALEMKPGAADEFARAEDLLQNGDLGGGVTVAEMRARLGR